MRTIQQILPSHLKSLNDLTISSPLPSNGVRNVGPFILLDHVGPLTFAPGQARELPAHPHRGFEPVSLLFEGGIEHKDSTGGHGVLKAHDVQWITAGSGIVHAEAPGGDVGTEGGRFHAVQLWVNLPKAHKMTAPKYQNIASERIPAIVDDGVRLRLIAGELGGKRGPASTFSPLILAHGIVKAGKSCALTIPTTMEAGIYVTHGELRSIGENLEARKLVVFNNDQDMIHLTANEDSEFLLLAGEPIHEPMVQYGPFVMNTSEEIHQAMLDYEAGKMGVIDF